MTASIGTSDETEGVDHRAVRAVTDAVLAHATDLVMFFAEDGTILWTSPASTRLFGTAPAELAGRSGFELIHPDDRDRVLADFAELSSLGDSVRTEFRVIDAAGRTRWVEEVATNLLDDPDVEAVVGHLRDVTDSVERRLEAERDRKRLADAQASAGLGSFEIDLRTGEVSRSEELWRILGRDPASRVELLSCVHADDVDQVQRSLAAARAAKQSDPVTHRIVRPDGSVRWVVSQISRDQSHPDHLFGTTLDITERHLAKLALAHQANHDPLTGVANRRLLVEKLEAALDRDRTTGRRTAILFIDLDDFKAINDRLGHHGGDAILRATGELIDGILPMGHTVARFGGDEFVVLCADIRDIDEVHRTVDRIRAALRTPFRAASETFTVTCSIGVALSGTASLADALVRDADAAMYAAKQQGPGRVEVFDQAMSEKAAHRRALVSELREALATGQLRTHFQPEIELRTGHLIGFEALARWEHPERGPISPAEFVPLAESSGLVDELGRVVLTDACEALAGWIERFPEHRVTVSVNVSGVQMADPELPAIVRAAIEATGVPPGRVCIEVTESALMDPNQAEEALRSLKEVGVLIAIDDFGTGYSSLSRLKRFPVDFLKIDQSFTAGLGHDPEDEVIVAAVTDLAHSLGVDVIAEGVEHQGQLELLATMGCELGQGFLWSPAVPADEVGALFDPDLPFARVREVEREDGPEVGTTNFGRRADHESEAIAVLVHELAHPLAVVGAYADLLRESEAAATDTELADGLEEIATAVRDMTAITELLRDTRPMDEGTVELDRQEVDVVALARDVASSLGLDDDDDHVVVRGAASAVAHVDPARMRQILRNLLGNALKWQHQRTWIEVCDDLTGRFVSVSVFDDGPGVPTERIGDLFRRFVRIDPRRPGTGLGLYVSRILARAHGGDIRYHRNPTGGSEFAVELPKPPAR